VIGPRVAGFGGHLRTGRRVALGGHGFGRVSARGELGEPVTRAKAGGDRLVERRLKHRRLNGGLCTDSRRSGDDDQRRCQ